MDIFILPNGQFKDTFNIVVAISQSASSVSFSLTIVNGQQKVIYAISEGRLQRKNKHLNLT